MPNKKPKDMILRTGKKPAGTICKMCNLTQLMTKRELASEMCRGCHEQMATPKEQGGHADVWKKETGGANDIGKGIGDNKTQEQDGGTGVSEGDGQAETEHREGELPN